MKEVEVEAEAEVEVEVEVVGGGWLAGRHLERGGVVVAGAPLDVILVVADVVPHPPPAEAGARHLLRRVHEREHPRVEERVGLDAVHDVELVQRA